jgi:WD40 repeat protein
LYRDASVDVAAFSTDGGLLATAGTGSEVYLWNPATGAPLGTVTVPGGSQVNSVAFSDMGTQLAVAAKNGTTYV